MPDVSVLLNLLLWALVWLHHRRWHRFFKNLYGQVYTRVRAMAPMLGFGVSSTLVGRTKDDAFALVHELEGPLDPDCIPSPHTSGASATCCTILCRRLLSVAALTKNTPAWQQCVHSRVCLFHLSAWIRR